MAVDLDLELPGGDLSPPDETGGTFDTDPAAPFGRTTDGTPKKGPGGRPPRARRARSSAGSSTGGAAPKPPGKTRGAGGRPSAPGARYAESAAGLIDGIAMILAGAGAATQSAPLLADSVTFKNAKPELAPALGAIAVDVPMLAAVFDKVGAVGGPAGALIALALPLAAQLARNHGVEAAGIMPGVVDPVTLLRQAGVPVATTAPAPETD